MKRLLVIALVVLMAMKLARRIPERSPRLMEHMMEHVMPKMMDSCFVQMGPERRRFMLRHCRSMLDNMQEKYVTAEAGAEEKTAT